MNRRVYLYFVVTFILGVVLGAAGVYYYGWSSGHWHHEGFNKEHAMARLKRELKLSDSQAQQVSQVFDETSRKMRDLGQQVEPQFHAVREDARNRIRQILNPEQVAKFNEMMKQIDERRRHHGPPPPPPSH